MTTERLMLPYTHIMILQSTHTIIDRLISSITSSQQEILLQTYYIDNDAVFAQVAQALIEKTKQGVSVYCLFDALGAKDIVGSSVEKDLLHAGVRIQYFNWLTPWASKNKKIWYFRNHKRSLIIDRNIVHTGGWCIGTKTQNWIEGYIQSSNQEVVTQAVLDFWNMYRYAHKTTLRFRHQKRYVHTNTTEESYTYHAPTFQGGYIYKTHKQLIQQSTNTIVLIAPYFAPIRSFRKALYQKAKKGVSVSIYIPEKTDTRITDLVARTYIHKLLACNISVYMIPTMLHAKAGLFDNTLYVGSTNLDAVSFRYNFENGIYTKRRADIESFSKEIESLQHTSTLITQEMWKKRSVLQKILDVCMKIFRPFV